MTAAVIFAGPSLPKADRPIKGVRFLPPAGQGDILRCLAARPSAIGLIDGVFGMTLSVHQKEIIEAMVQGIPVFGAASMGALRAAELAPFGMIGIGGIYEDYRSGRLEADADVAVTHGPAELGSVATTLAMVDLRATLAALSREYPEDTLDHLRATAEAIHFSDRTFTEIARRAGRMPFDVAALLRARFVSRKRQDALQLVTRMVRGPQSVTKPAVPLPITREYAQIRRRALAKREPSLT